MMTSKYLLIYIMWIHLFVSDGFPSVICLHVVLLIQKRAEFRWDFKSPWHTQETQALWLPGSPVLISVSHQITDRHPVSTFTNRRHPCAWWRFCWRWVLFCASITRDTGHLNHTISCCSVWTSAKVKGKTEERSLVHHRLPFWRYDWKRWYFHMNWNQVAAKDGVKDISLTFFIWKCENLDEYI